MCRRWYRSPNDVAMVAMKYFPVSIAERPFRAALGSKCSGCLADEFDQLLQAFNRARRQIVEREEDPATSPTGAKGMALLSQTRTPNVVIREDQDGQKKSKATGFSMRGKHELLFSNKLVYLRRHQRSLMPREKVEGIAGNSLDASPSTSTSILSFLLYPIVFVFHQRVSQSLSILQEDHQSYLQLRSDPSTPPFPTVEDGVLLKQDAVPELRRYAVPPRTLHPNRRNASQAMTPD